MKYEIVKLSDVCDLVAGFAFKSKDFGNFEDKVIKIADIVPPRVMMDNLIGVDMSNYKKDKLEKFIAKPGDYVLAMTGATIGKVGRIYEKTAYINQRVLLFRNHKNIDKDFLYYTIYGKTFYNYIISFVDSETAQPNISATTIGKYGLNLPPLNTQRKIASLLKSLDDKIELNNKVNENLEQQVYALFESWFVSLDKTDGIVPNDWHQGTLGDIASITSGKRPPMKQSIPTAEAKIPLVGAASIMGYTNAVLYNEPILVTGRVGTHGVVQRFQSPCWPSDNTLVIKSDLYEYAYQVLQRVDYVNMNRGSTQPLITQTDLKNVPVVLPPKSIILEFEEMASILMAKYQANCEENKSLSKLRDTLLPKLMSGEIDVSTQI